MTAPCVVPNPEQIALNHGVASNLTFLSGYTPIVIGAQGEHRMMPYLSIQTNNDDVSNQIASAMNIDRVPSAENIYQYFATRPQEVTDYCSKYGAVNTPNGFNRPQSQLNENNPTSTNTFNAENANAMQTIEQAGNGATPIPQNVSPSVLVEPGKLNLSAFRQRKVSEVTENNITIKGPSI